jgi:hypothetical protein
MTSDPHCAPLSPNRNPGPIITVAVALARFPPWPVLVRFWQDYTDDEEEYDTELRKGKTLGVPRTALTLTLTLTVADPSLTDTPPGPSSTVVHIIE